MLVAFLVLAMSAMSRCDVSLPELEFLVGQMSFGECQRLADALRVGSGASNVEGVTCLDELLRLHSTLKSEGPNIARGIFKHKLNQIGRRDLAQWLSIEKDPQVLTRPKNGAGEEQIPIEGKTGPLETVKKPTSWCEIAITIALLYTGALLVWLTLRVILCKMKKHFRDKGMAGGSHGYSYYPSAQQWPPSGTQWSPPSRQWLPPRQQWSPTEHPPTSQPQSPSKHHHYYPPTTSMSQPHMTRYDPQ